MYDLYFSWSSFSSSQFYLVVQNIIRHLYNAHIMKIHSLEQLPTKYQEMAKRDIIFFLLFDVCHGSNSETSSYDSINEHYGYNSSSNNMDSFSSASYETILPWIKLDGIIVDNPDYVYFLQPLAENKNFCVQVVTKSNLRMHEFVYGFLIMHVDGNREVWVFKNENMPLMRQYST
jgi:hypothetical protein